MESLKEELRKLFPDVANLEKSKVVTKRTHAAQILDKLALLATEFRLKPSELRDQWDAYALTNDVTEVTVRDLDKLRWQLDSTASSHRSGQSDVMEVDKHSITSSAFASHFNVTLPQVDIEASPTKNRKRSRNQMESESSAEAQTPVAPTPKQSKYKQRTDSGKVEVTFNGDVALPSIEKPDFTQLLVSLEPSCGAMEPYRFMYDTPASRSKAIDTRINTIGQVLLQKHQLEETHAFNVPSQEPMTALAMIACESEGKLNDKSVMLQREYMRVKLDLARTENYALFPGQVVCVQGMNAHGVRIVPDALYCDATLPHFSVPAEELPARKQGLRMIAACGPYTTRDDLDYLPLDDLLTHVAKVKPDVLFLMGPLVDSSHPHISGAQIQRTFDEVFEDVMDKISSRIPIDSGILVCIIPSLKDVTHDPIFPQPPFPSAGSQLPENIQMLPNPCVIKVQGISIGISCVDVIRHLCGATVSRGTNLDKMAQSVLFLLQQRSFYPMFPVAEEGEVNLDMSNWHKCDLPFTPDILILPSALQYFAKDVHDVVCINPGRLAIGSGGGVFAEIAIAPSQDDDSARKPVSSRTSVRIVRI